MQSKGSMKTCTKCGISKPHKLFALSNTTKSGLGSRCKACESQRGIERYARIKEKAKAQAKEYREKNYERRLEIERASRARNKEKNRPAKNARQSIRNKILAEKKFVILPKELRRIYNSPCLMCGSTENQSLDHIIPLSRGGRHSVGNITTLCLECNIKKRARTISEWKYQNR